MRVWREVGKRFNKIFANPICLMLFWENKKSPWCPKHNLLWLRYAK